MRITPLPTRKPTNLRPRAVIVRPTRARNDVAADGARGRAGRGRDGTTGTQAEEQGQDRSDALSTRAAGSGPDAARPRAAPDAPARVPRAGASLLRLRVGFLLIAMVRLGLRRPAVPAPGHRRPGVRRDGAGRGRRSAIVLPATRGAITDRNGVPLAESRRRADDRRRPADDPDDAERDRRRSSPTRLDARLLRDRSSGCAGPTPGSTTSPAGCPRPSPPRGRPSSTTRGYKGLDTRRDPVRDYPAGDVAANLLGFVNDEGEAAGRR